MKFVADLMVFLVLLVLGATIVLFEIARLFLFPVNWIQRRCMSSRRADVRRLVIFDGIWCAPGLNDSARVTLHMRREADTFIAL